MVPWWFLGVKYNQSLSLTKSINGVGQDFRDCGEELPQGPTGGRQVPEVEVLCIYN